MKDFKYLTAYLVPLMCLIGINQMGIWLFLTPFVVFVMVPLIELFMPSLPNNLSPEEKQVKLKNPFFDVLLWFNLPVIYGILWYGFYQYTHAYISDLETLGFVVSLGIVVGSNGINVAHELGHRQASWERFLGKILLLPSLYMHFYIEHNYHHHLKAATPEDPATARYNENLYAFWCRSVYQQYISAWKIQLKLNKAAQRSFFSWKNDMFWYTLIQIAYVLSIGLIFNWTCALLALMIAFVGFTLLEIINYLEHYGLRRAKKKSGRYEIVKERHSWNSNHALGRIMLYELTRHSDHHYRASKKFQILDYQDQAPQLPFGYPTMMVIAIVPPLWFRLVNKHVPKDMVDMALTPSRLDLQK